MGLAKQPKSKQKSSGKKFSREKPVTMNSENPICEVLLNQWVVTKATLIGIETMMGANGCSIPVID